MGKMKGRMKAITLLTEKASQDFKVSGHELWKLSFDSGKSSSVKQSSKQSSMDTSQGEFHSGIEASILATSVMGEETFAIAFIEVQKIMQIENKKQKKKNKKSKESEELEVAQQPQIIKKKLCRVDMEDVGSIIEDFGKQPPPETSMI